jgi:predicted transposase YdaD
MDLDQSEAPPRAGFCFSGLLIARTHFCTKTPRMHAASCAWAGYKHTMDHDHSYKLLFTHREMMRDFLEAFVTGEWVSDADFSTLERGNGNYITDDLRERADDIIWRVRSGDHMVYLLVEFQSRPDRFMAVRVLTYVGLLYQDLIRTSISRDLDELPAILPIVLHSGRKAWSAADDVATLIGDIPRELEPHRSRCHYLLIDQARYDDADLASRRNFAAMLFRIECCRRPELMQELVGTLMEWLNAPELEGLCRAFIAWLKRIVLQRMPAGVALNATNHLLEKHAMLSETIDEWEKEWFDGGWQKGLQEGRREELKKLLVMLLEKRFGELPEPVGTRLLDASLEELEFWTEPLLDATSLDDVVGCVQPIRADA